MLSTLGLRRDPGVFEVVSLLKLAGSRETLSSGRIRFVPRLNKLLVVSITFDLPTVLPSLDTLSEEPMLVNLGCGSLASWLLLMIPLLFPLDSFDVKSSSGSASGLDLDASLSLKFFEISLFPIVSDLIFDSVTFVACTDVSLILFGVFTAGRVVES